VRLLLRRGQETLVVRLNFVFFKDSVSELYGQRIILQNSQLNNNYYFVGTNSNAV
jgi:hypothetical protein